MSTWTYWANIICTDRALGNVIAATVDPDTGGAKTFDSATPLRSIGGADVVAWGVDTPLTESGKAYFDEFTSAGPYPKLEALGLTAPQIAAFKVALRIQHGARAGIEGQWEAFAASQGYEPLPVNLPA